MALEAVGAAASALLPVDCVRPLRILVLQADFQQYGQPAVTFAPVAVARATSGVVWCRCPDQERLLPLAIAAQSGGAFGRFLER